MLITLFVVFNVDTNTLKHFCRFLMHPLDVGSPTACSMYTGKELCRFLKKRRERDEALSILEIGAGSGSVTREIIKEKQDKDLFVAVEKDKGFAKSLKKEFDQINNVSIDCADILDWEPVQDGCFDCIICTLPFMNECISFDGIRNLFDDKFPRWLKRDGVFSFVELSLYGTIARGWLAVKNFCRNMLSPILGPAQLSEYEQRLEYMDRIKEENIFHVELVKNNTPDIYVYHACFHG